MKSLINKLLPKGKWQLPVSIVSGAMVGIIALLFHVSNATSYLSDDPKTCVNCHVMAPEYSSWFHSSHREKANCNDCHVPHDNVFNKYFFKAKDGLRHATIFTMRAEPQVIKIKEEGQEVVMDNCIRCHENLITDSKVMAKSGNFHNHKTDRQCWECHRETPHGRVKSLSSAPNNMSPLPESIVPEWIKELTNNKSK